MSNRCHLRGQRIRLLLGTDFDAEASFLLVYTTTTDTCAAAFGFYMLGQREMARWHWEAKRQRSFIKGKKKKAGDWKICEKITRALLMNY